MGQSTKKDETSYTRWPLYVSAADPTRIDAVDPETPREPYRIANCWSGPFAPTREIAAANARRIVAAWRAVRGIATADISLLDSLIREAAIMASYCRHCDGTGYAGPVHCHVCGTMRAILARIVPARPEGEARR